MSSSAFRHSSRDVLLVALSFVHPVALTLAPSIPLIALGVWWNSNTISHHFLHLPFFQAKAANRLYSLYLSVLLGIPQNIWRERHLAHHRGLASQVRWGSLASLEVLVVMALWGTLLLLSPPFFFTVYLPGIALGLVLCFLHGYFEHARGTTSNYGIFYNLAFFNDGYHVEHHERPSQHWSRMRDLRAEHTEASRWPAVLRWLDLFSLETPERLALRSPRIQSYLLRTHGRALRRLLPHFPAVRKITIVGGGMYPRSALLLRQLFPEATIRIIDSNSKHLDLAKPFLDSSFQFVHAHYGAGTSEDSDLLVIPLSFSECRRAVYQNPQAPAVLVHDWLWRRRGRSSIVSTLLLKRLNLILR